MTMTKSLAESRKEKKDVDQKRPNLNIRKIGIVARDYKKTSSFKKFLPDVLQRLDKEGCDAVLFSLFSLKAGYDPREVFRGLKNIKTVFVEKFVKDRESKKCTPKGFIVYYRTNSGWKEYSLKQRFSTLQHKKKKEICDFIENAMPERFLGNSCVLLCGESNLVKKVKENFDVFNFRDTIPKEVKIILNPCHDYMRRPIMNKKRKFLSHEKRWVISVWCKGKGKGEGKQPWKIFYNGKEYDVDETIHDFEANDVYVGILDVR